MVVSLRLIRRDLHDKKSRHRFIYDVYNNSNLSWVYGGEYADFTTLVETTAHAWLASGAELYFVFDGQSLQDLNG